MTTQQLSDYIAKRAILRRRWEEEGDHLALEEYLGMNRRQQIQEVEEERRKNVGE